jgi:hypothetical protein
MSKNQGSRGFQEDGKLPGKKSEVRSWMFREVDIAKLWALVGQSRDFGFHSEFRGSPWRISTVGDTMWLTFSNHFDELECSAEEPRRLLSHSHPGHEILWHGLERREWWWKKRSKLIQDQFWKKGSQDLLWRMRGQRDNQDRLLGLSSGVDGRATTPNKNDKERSHLSLGKKCNNSFLFKWTPFIQIDFHTFYLSS